MDDAPLALRALQSVFGLYGAAYVVAAIFAPSWFLDTLSVNQLEQRSTLRQRRRSMLNPSKPWYAIPAAILSVIAVGMLVYAASYAIVTVIPFDWGSRDAEGEWQSFRWMIQSGAGLVGGVALVSRLEANAEVLVWGPTEQEAGRAVARAVRQAHDMTPEITESILAGIERALPPKQTSTSFYASEYASGLQRRIRKDIRL